MSAVITGVFWTRQDEVDNTVHRAICDLAHRELEWDAALIGDVREAIAEVVCDRHKLVERDEFYPALEEDAFGDIHPRGLYDIVLIVIKYSRLNPEEAAKHAAGAIMVLIVLIFLAML